MLFALPSARAQQAATISGTVIDESNHPVIGATVIPYVGEIPSRGGTTTDRDGKFTIVVPADGHLVVSYVGYETVKVTDRTPDQTIRMRMSSQQIEGAVAIGYGKKDPKTLTGAVNVVSPEEIKDFMVGDLATSLRGLVPGLEVSNPNGYRPGEAATLIVRNANMNYLDDNFSNYGEQVEYVNTPLYVIDDYVTDEEEFNNLNPNEIESIVILKDASAAIYGVNGGRGVILVTTNRGQQGAARISYQFQYGWADAMQHPKMLDAYSYGKLWDAVVRAADRGGEEVDYREQLFSAYELEEMKKLDYNMLDKYWSPATRQTHSISLNGGNENATYFTNISYKTMDGNIGRLEYNLWNFRSGVNANLGKWVKASMNVSGNFATQESAYSSMGGGGNGQINDETDYRVLLANPRYIPESVNGMPIVRNGVFNEKGENNTQNYNFDVIQKSENFQRQTPSSLSIQMSLQYDFGAINFLKGLVTRVNYSKSIETTKTNRALGDITIFRMIERADGQGGSSEKYGHLYTGPGVNTDPSNFEKMVLSTAGGTAGNGYISRDMARSDNYQLKWQTDYGRTFGLHDITALFAIDKSESESETLEGKREKPYTFTNGQSVTASGDYSGQFGRSESGMLSYVGRVSYDYADKYLFDFTLRADASTKFAPSNYWGLFPSIGLGWVISEEPWMKSRPNSAISFLKLRGTVGMMGADNIQAWTWMNSFGVGGSRVIFGTNPYAETNTSIQTTYPPGTSGPAPNPEAHWDRKYPINLGIDANFFKSRLSFKVDMFYNFNRDQFMSFRGTDKYASTVGALAATENFGATNNWGIELEAGWRGKIASDWNYRISANTSFGDNKVLVAPWPSIFQIGQTRPNERNQSVAQWAMDCLGIFRSYQEIDEYFDKYHITQYMGLPKDQVHPGMLIYRDVRGRKENSASVIARNPELFDEWGYYIEPDGVVGNGDDYGDIIKLTDRGNYLQCNLNFGASYRNSFSLSGQVQMAWGGYSFVDSNARGALNLVTGKGEDYKSMQASNMPVFWNDMFIYDDVYDTYGNLVVAQNRDGAYPNLRYSGVNSVTSTFWKVNGFSAIWRNLTLAYTLPNRITDYVGISNCRLNVTVQNVMTFYNPYPAKFKSPMVSYAAYPETRTISLGLNVSF
jgi:TonB-linked SusC/RagA family outer membrane protein